MFIDLTNDWMIKPKNNYIISKFRWFLFCQITKMKNAINLTNTKIGPNTVWSNDSIHWVPVESNVYPVAQDMQFPEVSHFPQLESGHDTHFEEE